MLATPLLDRLADTSTAVLDGGTGQGRSGARVAAVAAMARELTFLLNAHCLEGCADLEAYPAVARSVLNYGMPSLAGMAASSINPQTIAERIKITIESFEPRLNDVRIVPVPVTGPTTELRFRIHGLLLLPGEPSPVVLETHIALGDGDIRVAAEGSG